MRYIYIYTALIETYMGKTTILIEKSTREVLKQLGSKGQSYDNLINWLIRNKSRQIKDRNFLKLETKYLLEKKDSLDNEFASHISSEPQ